MRVERERNGRLEEALDRLLREEPYLAYANFPPLSEPWDKLLILHRRRILSAAGREGALVCRDDEKRPLAVLCPRNLEFESAHFGMRMARVDPPLGIASEEFRLAALRALYRVAREELRAAGYQHMAAACSTQDRVAAWVLQEIGCFYVGTRITWMQPLTGRRASSTTCGPLTIEEFDRNALLSLDRRRWRRLYDWSAKAFDRGPYVFDLSVPRDRAMEIYQVWTEKALSGEWADYVLLVFDGDDAVAFHTMQVLPDLSESSGVTILGRGIGGTLPGYRGLFTALQKECSARRPLGASFLENETQASTIQSINVFGKLGHHCIRSVASFHATL